MESSHGVNCWNFSSSSPSTCPLAVSCVEWSSACDHKSSVHPHSQRTVATKKERHKDQRDLNVIKTEYVGRLNSKKEHGVRGLMTNTLFHHSLSTFALRFLAISLGESWMNNSATALKVDIIPLFTSHRWADSHCRSYSGTQSLARLQHTRFHICYSRHLFCWFPSPQVFNSLWTSFFLMALLCICIWPEFVLMASLFLIESFRPLDLSSALYQNVMMISPRHPQFRTWGFNNFFK